MVWCCVTLLLIYQAPPANGKAQPPPPKPGHGQAMHVVHARSVVGLFKRPGPFVAGSNCSRSSPWSGNWLGSCALTTMPRLLCINKSIHLLSLKLKLHHPRKPLRARLHQPRKRDLEGMYGGQKSDAARDRHVRSSC